MTVQTYCYINRVKDLVAIPLGKSRRYNYSASVFYCRSLEICKTFKFFNLSVNEIFLVIVFKYSSPALDPHPFIGFGPEPELS